MKKYEYFGYSVNEALHLSEKEKTIITGGGATFAVCVISCIARTALAGATARGGVL